jgi:hypothetical protein
LTQGGVVQSTFLWALFLGSLFALFKHLAVPRWKQDARGVIVVFFPSWVYDLSTYLLFPLNWLIHVSCYLQPGTNEWDEVRTESGADLPGLAASLLAGGHVAITVSWNGPLLGGLM